MSRIASKIDANQPEIVEGLRAIGCHVTSLADVGDGCPDLLVGYRGIVFAIEVKVPGKQLNAIQKKWHREFQGTAHVVWSLREAIDIVTQYKKAA